MVEYRNDDQERAGVGDGILASIVASQNATQSSQFTMVGTNGEVTLAPAFAMEARRTLTLARGDTSAEVSFDPKNEMTEVFDYFADRALTGREIIPDGEHGLVDIRTIEAIYESAESGERFEV